MLKINANERRSRCRRLTPVLLAGVVAAAAGIFPPTGLAQAQTAPQAQVQTSAQQGTGSASVAKTTNLGAMSPMTSAEAHPQPLPPQTGVDAATYAARKAKAAASRTAPVSGAAPSATPGQQQTSLQNPVLTPSASPVFQSTGEVACGNVTPADQALAVGQTPPNVLQVINVCLDVYNTAGVLQPGYPKSLTSFVGLPASTPTSDPRAMYDWINHRYIVAFIQFDPSFASASSYWIAVSTADNPAGSYCIYHLGVQSVAPSGGVFPLPDFPRLGQDRQAIYLASNIFNPGYKWEEVLALPKAKMYGCQSISFPFFFNLNLGGVPTDTTQPANISGLADDPRSEYLITSKNIRFGGGQCSSPCNGLIVWALNSPLSGATLSGTFVPTTNNYSLPPNATQPGAANSVDSGDTRISGMAMYAAGSIYASLNTNGGQGQPAFIQYQVQPFINQTNGHISSARILNEVPHLLNDAQSFFYATQQPDPEGNVTTVFNFSDASHFVGLAYLSRRAAQPVGTTPDNGIFAVQGAALYNQGRWGDYTAVAPGGVGTTTPRMWFAGMFANSDHNWKTAIGRNGYTSITQQTAQAPGVASTEP